MLSKKRISGDTMESLKWDLNIAGRMEVKTEVLDLITALIESQKLLIDTLPAGSERRLAEENYLHGLEAVMFCVQSNIKVGP